MRILLIEDNRDHAELIQRSLHHGLPRVQVRLTSTAREAYRILRNGDFDLVLSDFYLPDAKGESHIRQLNKRAPEIPIVVITGQGDEKAAARSIKAGAEDYVVKTREVLAALPRILKRVVVKHHSHQNKRKKEMARHFHHQKQKVKKVLGEMKAIDRKMKVLKRQNSKSVRRATKGHVSPPLESLMQRIESLKKFIRGMFLTRH
jgi:DNA-binding NtrC family response regulator